MPQNAASDLGLHCLPLIQQYVSLINRYYTIKIDLYNFLDKYGKELMCPNI